MENITRMDIVQIELNSGNLHRSWLNHSIGSGDIQANAFGVDVFRDGEPVSLSGGSVQGYFRDPRGNNIAITTGNTVSGNRAYVVLPQACYNYDGQFTLAIKVIGGGVTGTMRIVDGIVDNTNTGSAVAPTGTVPTYQEVLAVYDQMVAAKEGSVRFDIDQSLTTAQKTRARNNVEAASQGDVSDLKSALKVMSNFPDLSWTVGKGINSSTGAIENSQYEAISNEICVEPGDVFKRNTPAKTSGNVNISMRVASYNGNSFISRDTVASGNSLTIPNNATKIIIDFAHPSASGTAMTQETIDTYFSAELYRKVVAEVDFKEYDKTNLIYRGGVIEYTTARGLQNKIQNCKEPGYYTFISTERNDISDLPETYPATGGVIVTYKKSDENIWQVLMNATEIYIRFPISADFVNIIQAAIDEYDQTSMAYRGSVVSLGYTTLSQCNEVGYYSFIKPDVESITDLPDDVNTAGSLIVMPFGSQLMQMIVTKDYIYTRNYSASNWNKIGSDILPDYWVEEINDGIEKINTNIVEQSLNSVSLLFVTDCHWAKNNKLSPMIAKELLNACSFNYFINCGDYLDGIDKLKSVAIKEVTDCIHAFSGLRLPMLCVNGNHDKNYQSSQGDPEEELSKTEVVNMIYKSYLPDNKFSVFSGQLSQYEAVVFEDAYYKYCLMYFGNEDSDPGMTYSASNPPAWVAEVFNTQKKIVFITHQIYSMLKTNDSNSDVISSQWVLDVLEPYKNMLKCIIQGDAHRSGLRRAYKTGNFVGIPIIILGEDKMEGGRTRTITEQSLTGMTIGEDVINIVKIGKGTDIDITDSTPDYTDRY